MSLLSEFLGTEEYSIKELPLFKELIENIKRDDLFEYSTAVKKVEIFFDDNSKVNIVNNSLSGLINDKQVEDNSKSSYFYKGLTNSDFYKNGIGAA
ncbi:hypothetical protein ACVR0O_07815 [Streptococcus caviae]|uniref:hypothetical protein n=1 Tax=Streptococcus sp. 'caviae' TaxID=1915004 RepID=UPI00094BAAAF|nr:hypothetical protein [Streptococcus sp. 'caviae']OLN83031.1 hypothetical protein BMI76_07175 [Streptococcus sp. 'caviae']